MNLCGIALRLLRLNSLVFTMPISSRGKRVRDAFYTQEDPDGNKWLCRCGTIRKQGGPRYKNLVQHIQSQHPEEYQKLFKNPRE